MRHGALLGLSRLLPALAAAGGGAGLGIHLDGKQQASLSALVHDVEAARLLRGRGGEPMRAALCRCGAFLQFLYLMYWQCLS